MSEPKPEPKPEPKSEPDPKQSKSEPLVQYAQKCAWCGRYLVGSESDFAIYNGKDPLYKGWVCHYECNLDNLDNLSDLSDISDLTDLDNPNN